MCEAAAEDECLDLRTCACCVEFLLAVVCTEGVVHCDFPVCKGGHAGSLATPRLRARKSHLLVELRILCSSNARHDQ